MGAGILPVSIYNNKLYFLLGKENKFNDSPGWSDFGGGKEGNESIIQTAAREGSEELNGFLGDEKEIKNLIINNLILKVGIKYYTTFIVNVKYSKELPNYFNKNFKFNMSHLGNLVEENNGLFEKERIKWFSIDELKKEENYRSYYGPIIKTIIKKEKKIMDKLK
jgi:8-oxo-dGTP pyrophosphatase MutT (NUDIX family)|tara:strand:+ start:1723 stop:2217 length:495 start_codon:yes stop_codon:yes gene_type:complete